MSVVSRLITLGAAGAGGSENWALEFTASNSINSGQATADAVFFSQTVYGDTSRSYVFSVNYDGAINWQKKIGTEPFYTEGIAVTANELHIGASQAFQSSRYVVYSISPSTGAPVRNAYYPSSGFRGPETYESIATDGTNVFYTALVSGSTELRRYAPSGSSAYSNTWAIEKSNNTADPAVWVQASNAYLSYRDTSSYLGIISKRNTSNGGFNWAYYYLPSGYVASQIHDVSFLSNGHLIVVGDITLDNTFRNDNFVMRLDGNGNVQWFKFVNHGQSQAQQDVVVDTATDEIYTVQAYTSSFNDVSKFDASGNLIWSSRFSNFNSNGRDNFITTSSGSGFVFAGMFDDSSKDSVLYKIISDGVSDGTYGRTTITSVTPSYTTVTPVRTSVGNQLSTVSTNATLAATISTTDGALTPTLVPI